MCVLSSAPLVVWGIAISYDYSRRQDEREVGVYILVDLIIGIIMPTLFFIAAVLMSVVLSFITNNHLDGRKAIARLLPSVRFMEAEKNNYWVIENIFYFRLRRHTDLSKHGCCYAWDKNRSTWLLVAIIFLTILLTFSYFVNQSVVRVRSVSSCSDVPGSFECFNETSLAFVDCSEGAPATPVLHCFQFLEFGKDVSIVSSVAEAFAFYLATAVFFQYIFIAVKVLLNLKRTKFWGVPIIFLGAVMVVGAIIVLPVSDSVRIELNVIGVLQFFMISIFLVIIGTLLVDVEWFELTPKPVYKSLALARPKTHAEELAPIGGEAQHADTTHNTDV